jgi:hypothetical protein
MLRGRVTNSMGFGGSQGQDNGAMITQPNKSNFELESATSPSLIGPLSRMRYHWKALIFYCYGVRVSHQFNGLGRLSRLREWCHVNRTKQSEFWTWKCHISTDNRTPESNEVSLESSSILLLCCEGESPIQWALETLKVETMVPWQQNQTNRILNLKVPHLHR